MDDVTLYSWAQCPMWFKCMFPRYDEREEFLKDKEVLAVLLVKNPEWNQETTKRMLALFSQDPTFDVRRTLDQVPYRAMFWVGFKP